MHKLNIILLLLLFTTNAFSEETKEKELHSIVLLQNKVTKVSEKMIKDFITKTTGLKEANEPGKGKFFIAYQEMDDVITNCLMSIEGDMYLFQHWKKPYFDNSEKLYKKIENERIAKVVKETKCWISIDVLGAENSTPEALNKHYQTIGKIIVNFMSQETIAIYHPPSRKINFNDDEIKKILLSKNPLEAFSKEIESPVIGIKSDDEIMKEAINQALKELNTFNKSFQNRKPEQKFAIKAKFTQGDDGEFMWVLLTDMNKESYKGLLLNEPLYVKNVKKNDIVTVKQANIIDWMFNDGEDVKGGYTEIAIQKIRANKQTKGNE